MKKNVLTVLTTVALGFSGYALYVLSSSFAGQFQELYSAFDIKVPQITSFVLLSLLFWPVMFGFVAALSFLPVLFCTSKVRYLGIAFPIIFPVAILLALYAPTVLQGSAI